jgi:tetratricopeptide (TPR) repeat protein
LGHSFRRNFGSRQEASISTRDTESVIMKNLLLTTALSAAIMAIASSASAHDQRYHVAQTELKQFTGVARPDAVLGEDVPLWENLLGHPFRISTGVPEAQRYFDQGIMLTFGFNHAEAARSFRRAQELDPTCAICHWGEAFVLGPNINMPMDPDANAPALAAIARAKSLIGSANEREQALIAALDKRYSETADRAELDVAFADAMQAVFERFPDDDDIAVLYAEALMDLSPWDYWEQDGAAPKHRTADIVATLEQVLQRNPDHPGAIHLYIHAVEASDRPERAEPYADRLAAMDVGAGHLVHMPSHIYYRIGRYKDALDTNVRAVAADEAFFEKVPPGGVYAGGYYPHNIHFLLVSAQMSGDGPTAVEAAEKLNQSVSDELAALAAPLVQPIKAAPLFAHAQFSDPQTILAIAEPSGDFPYVDAMWRYMRGVGHVGMGDVAAARAERAEIARLSRTGDFSNLVDGGMPAPEVLEIAGLVLDARIAHAEGELALAAALFAKAKVIEDGLAYMEPRFWYYPVGQSLGSVLLQIGDLDGAQAAFDDSLKLAPNNGLSIFGLAKVHEARGDMAMVEETLAQLERIWAGDPSQLDLNRM